MCIREFNCTAIVNNSSFIVNKGLDPRLVCGVVLCSAVHHSISAQRGEGGWGKVVLSVLDPVNDYTCPHFKWP